MKLFFKKYQIHNILFFSIAIITFFVVFLNNGQRYNLSILSIFMSIGLFSLYGIFGSMDTMSYSLNKTFCLFYYFFFSLAPAVQFKNNASFFSVEPLTNEIYMKYGSLLLGILVLYLIGYQLLLNFLIQQESTTETETETVKEREYSVIFFYSISILALAIYFYLIKFNWNVLVYRPQENWMKLNSNLGLIGYSILSIMRYVPFFVLLYALWLKKKRDKHTFILLLLFLVSCFPTSLSRGILAALYIPLFILYLPFLRKGFNYVLLFMGGVLVVFPLFNSFRFFKEGIFKFDYQLFNSGHFDAFQNLSLLINESIITNGRQFLGGLLFFVQESQWENKPHGTGHLLGETVGYSYLNVAMPYFAEGYANWGYLGILLFLVVLIFFNAFLDFKQLQGFKKLYIKAFYFIMLGFEFYLLRGDLSSSIKKITGFLLALTIVELLVFVYHKRYFSTPIKV